MWFQLDRDRLYCPRHAMQVYLSDFKPRYVENIDDADISKNPFPICYLNTQSEKR